MVGTHTLIREEGFCRLLRKLYIPTAYTVTTDNQFSFFTYVQFLALVVHDIETGIHHRTANGNIAIVLHHCRRTAHSALSRTIYIQDDTVFAYLAQPAVQSAGKCLGTDVVESDLPQCFPTDVHIHNIHQKGRGTCNARHSAVCNGLCQQQRIVNLLIRGHTDRITIT